MAETRPWSGGNLIAQALFFGRLRGQLNVHRGDLFFGVLDPAQGVRLFGRSRAGRPVRGAWRRRRRFGFRLGLEIDDPALQVDDVGVLGLHVHLEALEGLSRGVELLGRGAARPDSRRRALDLPAGRGLARLAGRLRFRFEFGENPLEEQPSITVAVRRVEDGLHLQLQVVHHLHVGVALGRQLACMAALEVRDLLFLIREPSAGGDELRLQELAGRGGLIRAVGDALVLEFPGQSLRDLHRLLGVVGRVGNPEGVALHGVDHDIAAHRFDDVFHRQALPLSADRDRDLG